MPSLARIVAGIALLLAATRAGAAETVTMGWTPSTPMAPALIATDKGYFARLGLAPDLDAFRGAMDAMAALATGQLDVSLGGVTAGLFNGIARGLDARVVAPLSIQPPAPGSTPLVVRKDLWDGGTIRAAADLKGRKVAVNGAGNGIDYKLSLILATAGMSLKDIDVTKLGFAEMVTALTTKGIDAGVVGEPFATLAVRQGHGVIMMKESDAGKGDVTTFVLFSGKFIRERPDVAVRFLKGLRQGMLDLTDGKWREPENVAILIKYLKTDRDILLASTFAEFDPSLAIDKYLDSIRRQEAMHRKNGFLNYAEPLDAAVMLDTALAKEARGG
jgi:ABC-type nitrate/sulfonate/bicarbonate transport system substrate-binding protein